MQKIRSAIVFVFLALPLGAQTYTTQAGPVIAMDKKPTAGVMVYRGEVGKWWQNSDTVKKLQLTDAQINQLEQIFFDHRMKLIDYGADMEKQDLKLQTLLDADVPDEGQISTQVDQVLEARGKLEREFTTMNLDLRKVLSLTQWRQLKSIRGSVGGFGDRIFFRKAIPPGSGPEVTPLPPLPPPPAE
jgi:Spy/CpxP family protein refolding chaperone